MELATRRAEPADEAVVADLLAAAVAEAEGRRGGPEALDRWPGGDPRDPASRGQMLEAALASDELLVYLARFEGADVGVGVLRALDGGARIELAYVLQGARGVGVGDALLEAMADAAVRLGARWLDAVALPGDRATKSLYERGGLVAREITLRRSLEA